jgi:hypothetical protein
MNNPKKRCAYCHRWYRPDPRTRKQQLACGAAACRKKRKAQADRTWRKKNPGYAAARKPKMRVWAAEYPDYWSYYRKTHPEYADREQKRMSSKRLQFKSVAKQDARRQIAVDKLQSIQNRPPKTVAKQDEIHRRVNGIVDYLFWKEGVAKPNDTDYGNLPSVQYCP